MPGEFPDLDRQLSPYFIRSTDVGDIGSGAIDTAALASDAHPTLWDYWVIIRKHQSLVLALLVLMLTVTGLVVFTMTPVYTAESTLLIERQAPQVLDMKGLTNEAQEGADQTDYYKTQYEILRSRSLAAQVIRSMGLAQNALFTGDSQRSGLLTGTIAQLKRLLQGTGDKSYQNYGPEDEFVVDPELLDAYLRRLSSC